MKKTLLAVFVGVVLCSVMALFAAEKQMKNDMMKHPNLEAAQKLIDQALMKITAAQKANEFDMAGHAQKAKDLLDQSLSELKMAAMKATENGEKKDMSGGGSMTPTTTTPSK